MQGRIVKSLAGFYYVESDGVVYQTRARGNFRKKGQIPTLGIGLNFLRKINQKDIFYQLKSVKIASYDHLLLILIKLSLSCLLKNLILTLTY